MTLDLTESEHAILTFVLSNKSAIPVPIDEIPAVGAILYSIRQKLAAPVPAKPAKGIVKPKGSVKR